MKDYLLEKTSTKDRDFSLEKDELDDDYDVIEAFDRIHTTSKFKRHLAFILFKFHSCQILIIFIGFLLGFFTLGLPLLCIYYNKIKNKIYPFLFISIFTLAFSVILIIIHIFDEKNKYVLLEKLQRKNILKNIGMSITSILLIIAICLSIKFYGQAIEDLENEYIILDNQNTSMSKIFESDFIFKYNLNMIFFVPSKINENNEKNDIKYYFNGEETVDQLRKYLMISLIPLLIISFNKVIKTILIQVKYTVEQFIFFFGTLLLCLFTIIINNFTTNEISQLNTKIISIFQIINIIIIYTGYISWILHNSFKLFSNPKDKNFSIRRYKLLNIIFIIIFDLISLVGATLFVLSVLYLFISSIFGKENFQNLNISFFLLKISFLFILIGNSYYFGHYILSMILRPVAIQFAPYKLKNDCYVKANVRLKNMMRAREAAQNMKNIKIVNAKI